MNQALSPRKPRVRSRVWVSLVVIVAFPSAGFSQTPKDQAKSTPAKSATAKDAPAASKDAPQPTVDVSSIAKAAPIEIYRDPRVEATLSGNFKTYPPITITALQRSAVRAMASGQVSLERGLLSRFVDGQIAALTNPANIKAIVDPPAKLSPTSDTVRAVEGASNALIELLPIAKTAKNADFLNVYNKMLVEKLEPLLQHHMIPRIQAAIILGNTGYIDAVGLFVKEIVNPEQIVWVKQWAARGITNAIQSGDVWRELDTQSAVSASAAIAGFLEKELDAPWPVQLRMVEALGSIRLATPNVLQGRAEHAATVMKLLADENLHPQVRATAAWALGMIRVSQQLRYNVELVAYHDGRLAATLAERIGAQYDEHSSLFEQFKDQANLDTSLLVFQILPSFAGEPAARDSGLLNTRGTSADAARSFMRELDTRIKAVSRAALDLVRAGGALQASKRDVLKNRLAELNVVLEKNPPKDLKLYPNGPEFPVAPKQVAARGE